MTKEHELADCRRCGHPADWHRHDDEACHKKHAQPCDPSTAPFRCLGYDCERGGPIRGTPESRCGCTDYLRSAETCPKCGTEAEPLTGWKCPACRLRWPAGETVRERIEALLDAFPHEGILRAMEAEGLKLCVSFQVPIALIRALRRSREGK